MVPPAEVLAAGWPAAIGLAAVLALTRSRERSRRASLEAAIHELRRPLHALSLAAPRCARTDGAPCTGPSGEHLSGALAALGDLEWVVADSKPALRLRPMSLRALVDAALERCVQPIPAAELSWAAGDARILADPARLGRALDNLLENAIEHGRPPVRISASICAGGVRLLIANAVAAGHGRAGTAPLRGYGLGIVSSTVRAHGGRFLFDRGERSATAMLELPLVPPSLPVRAGDVVAGADARAGAA
jgi:signal transduction histidine kinase